MAQNPPEDGKHVVQDGQWVGSIAMQYGFADWENDVWNIGGNSDLRQLRTDPRLLVEGDVLHIPKWSDHKETCANEQRHKFKLKVPSEVLRIRILDENGDPVKNADYKLEVQCNSGGGDYKQKKTSTDGEGVLTEAIPSTAYEARVIIASANIDLKLDLGRMVPFEKDNNDRNNLAAKQRLSGLGYYSGPIDSDPSDALTQAILKFQIFCKDQSDNGDSSLSDPGDPDGQLTDKTIDALKKYFGC